MLNLLKELNKLRVLLTKRDMWKFIILLGLMFLASLFEAVGIGAIPLFVSMVMKPSSLSEIDWVGDWFTALPDEPSVQLVFWASSALFAFIVFKNIFLFFVFYVQARTVTSQRAKLSDRMFQVYQSAPYEWHLRRSSSELLNNIQHDTNQIFSGVVMPFLDLVMGLIMASAIIAILLLGTPGPAMVSLVVTGVGVYAVITLFHKRLSRIGNILRRENQNIIKAIQQGFGALIDARIIGCEAHLNEVHRSSLEREANALCHRITIQKSSFLVIETIAILGLLVILLILVYTTDFIGAVLPVIALLSVATIRLKQIASRIVTAVNSINAALAFIPGIVNDLQELDAIERKRCTTSGSQNINNFEVLKLENVFYTYPDTETPALHDISLDLKKGESIAFVGATGCGKSTLVNLILGLLEPKSGQIMVNNTDISHDIKGWRTQLGYIQQTIFLIDDTVRANVAFGVPKKEVNEEQLWSALHSARLVDFILALPNKLDTVIGERGVRLSGGQRQRLGIARALYHNHEVLVMDEATSALDNKTEKEVMEAIENLKHSCTLIMIAHRLSSVKDCDRLYFISEGKIETSGSFDELQQKSGAFHKMLMG